MIVAIDWDKEGTGVNQPRPTNPKTPDTKPKGPEKPRGQPEHPNK